jgi:hypothetical protein
MDHQQELIQKMNYHNNKSSPFILANCSHLVGGFGFGSCWTEKKYVKEVKQHLNGTSSYSTYVANTWAHQIKNHLIVQVSFSLVD